MAVQAGPLTPYMAPNPYLQAVLASFPSGAAANPQDIGQQLYNFSGQSLPIVTYPLWNPLGGFLQGGTTLPGFQGLGFPAQFGAATVAGAGGGNAVGGATINNGGTATPPNTQGTPGTITGGTTNTNAGANNNANATLLQSLQQLLANAGAGGGNGTANNNGAANNNGTGNLLQSLQQLLNNTGGQTGAGDVSRTQANRRTVQNNNFNALPTTRQTTQFGNFDRVLNNQTRTMNTRNATQTVRRTSFLA